MPAIHKFWNLVVVVGRLKATPSKSINKTMNFLKDRKAARGMIVIQYDESRLLKHIKSE